MKHFIHFVSLAICVLLSTTTLHAASVVRGPYLQLQTQDSIIVRWRSDTATDSVVRYGLTPGNLDQSKTVAGSRTEHSVQLTGLSTGQQYYYSVGDSIAALAGDASYHFSTAPAVGNPADTRIWVLGDSGTADSNAVAVRNAYSSWAGSDPADFLLMLGDNAYNDGTDAEYQAAVFNIYPQMLRQMPVWATLGNHDGHSADSQFQTGVYYDIFEFPTNAEAGGLPSGTEAYYSFDYANIHFINLDSYDTPRSVGSAMLNWLEADLATNTQPWVIAFWHHPPYTKGSHNSDTEGNLIDMRQNALPLLESWGVDLVMTGHSHSYERSYLIDGHYGNSGSFNPATHRLDAGGGSATTGGAYEKPGIIAAENAGAVYAVAGSSGKISGGLLNHPAMFISLNSLGSMVLDISGNQLDAVFLNQSGSVLDRFSIVKTPDSNPPLISAASAEDANHVVVDFNEPIDAASATNPANFAIAGLSISAAELLAGNRSVRLTTSTMSDGTQYTLVVNNVQDLIGNTIAANSSTNFVFYVLVEQSFQDGIAPTSSYGGTRDAQIREAAPITNLGSATSLNVDGDDPSGNGTDSYGLLQWDISAIPAGAVVEAAELVLEITNISTGSYSCFGLERSWTESQVTWNVAATGSAWATAGAKAASDRNSNVLCTVNAGSVGSLTVPLNSAGIARVQSWVNNPGSNRGLIIADTSTSDGVDFHSSESATAVARPRLNIIYRVDAPPPNGLPTAGFSFTCTGLDCSFTDSSTDSDGTITTRSWNFGDGSSSSASNPSHAYAAEGGYTVTLSVTDDDGATDQDVQLVNVTEPPPPPAFVDQFALADIATSGSSSGNYLSTHSDNGVAQGLTERTSGGNKNQRYSYLEHTWQFSVVPGTTVMLYANAWSGGSADGDAFRFSWSADGNNFNTLFTVSSTSNSNVQGAPIPASGTIYIRVNDTNQQAGNSALDTVFVDHLYIRSENGEPPPNNPPTANFSFSCSGLACSFTNTSGDTDGSIVSSAWAFGDGATSGATNPSRTYAAAGTYPVALTVTDDDGDSNNISKNVTVSAASAISLSASGSKVKGVNTADLNWSGAAGSNVRILRDGSLVTNTANDGAHTDNTGDKGGRTYIYRVCETSPSTNCSNEVTLVF